MTAPRATPPCPELARLHDKSGEAMPVPEGDTHICKLWYASDGIERSAKVENAVEGIERDKLAKANDTLYGAAIRDDPSCKLAEK